MEKRRIIDLPAPKKPDLDEPIPDVVYPVIDTDLGRDNVENHIPAADLNDLGHGVSDVLGVDFWT